ncbi:MAG: hypothetical protein KGR26_05925, partial [Cyanobacteria bacterium REEB65]|nr:hypothetical protein [Cyanobacteria bacterium REEB65]
MNNILASGAVTRKSRAQSRAWLVTVLGFMAIVSFAMLAALMLALKAHHGDRLNTAVLLDIHQSYSASGGKLAALCSHLFAPALMAAIGVAAAVAAWRF